MFLAISIFLFIVSFGVWFWIFRLIYLSIVSQKWPVAKGIIKESSLVNYRSSGERRRNQFTYHVKYEYSVDNKVYSCANRTFSEKYFTQNYSKNFVDSLVLKYPEGSEVMVRYNAKKPHVAVLDTGVHLLKQYWVFALGLFLLAGGILFLSNI